MLLRIDAREAAQHLAHPGGGGVAGSERVGGVAVELGLGWVLEVEFGEDLLAPRSLLDPGR
eukprot:11078534-Alexandrium_andersonii.AAC.1